MWSSHSKWMISNVLIRKIQGMELIILFSQTMGTIGILWWILLSAVHSK
jgi:hypothetical protein